MKVLRKNAAYVGAIVGLMTIAAVVGAYILHNQRVRFPFVDEDRWTLKAEFSTAQAVAPGQGQTVRISGIRIGDITKVDLVNGRAIVTMEVDQDYRDLVRRDSSALLRPRTGLKDMFVELDPGRAPGRVPDAFTIPLERTNPDVNLDEILAVLDGDTRDYLKFLLHDLSTGLDGEGATLGELLRRLEPTNRDIAKVSSTVAARQAELRRLVDHLGDLNGELARNDQELVRLVRRSAVVFRRLGGREARISETVRELPAALRETTRGLARVKRFADVIPDSTTKLRPVVRELTRANRKITPAAKTTAPILRDDVRPFVRAARPLVGQLRRPTAQLNTAADDLRRVGLATNHLFNQVARNPGGRQGPEVAGREEGYLFWLGWLTHTTNSVFSSSDAHGTFRSIGLTSTCATLKSFLGDNPQAEFVLGLTPLVTSTEGCGGLNIPMPTLRKSPR